MLDVTRLRVLVAVARHGSVTAAARALNYAQPSVSHHIARLEAETGARLTQRAGRGVRLTDAGRLLAERAEEIIGRLDAAENELAAHVGLRGGRIRLAAFPSALGTIVPAAAARLEAEHPGMDLTLAEAEPPEALRMLRAGYVDVALVFRHTQDGVAAAPSETDDGTRATLLLDDPIYLVTQACTSSSSHHPRSPDPRSPDHPRSPDPRSPDPRSPDPRSPDPRSPDPRSPDPRSPHPRPARVAPPGERALPAEPDLADFADRRWIAGCERCRTTLPGLALRAARHPGIQAAALPGAHRQVLAVTYGEPPDAPAVARLLEVLTLTVGAEHPAPLPRTPIHAVDSR